MPTALRLTFVGDHVSCSQGFKLPRNVRATTNAAEAISGAQYAIHAVPVQSSRAFLVGVRDLLPPTVPIICVSKGLEVSTTQRLGNEFTMPLFRKYNLWSWSARPMSGHVIMRRMPMDLTSPKWLDTVNTL